MGVYCRAMPPPILFRVLNLFAAFLLQNSQDLKLFLHILQISSWNKRFDCASFIFELHGSSPFCGHSLHVDTVHCDAVEFSEWVDDDCSMMGGRICFRRG